MYGFHIRTLLIAKKTHSGSIVPLWLLTGEQGKVWQKAEVSVILQKQDQVQNDISLIYRQCLMKIIILFAIIT